MMYRAIGSSNVVGLYPEDNEREMWKKGTDGKYRSILKQENVSDKDLVQEYQKVCNSIANGGYSLEIVKNSEISKMEFI